MSCLERIINKLFTARANKANQAILTPDQIKKREEEAKDKLVQRVRDLSEMVNSDNSGWKQVRSLIEERIENCLAAKLKLDSRKPEDLAIMNDIDIEIDAMTRFNKIPGFFISQHEHLLSDDNV